MNDDDDDEYTGEIPRGLFYGSADENDGTGKSIPSDHCGSNNDYRVQRHTNSAESPLWGVTMTEKNTGSYGPLPRSSIGRRQSDTSNTLPRHRSVSFGPVTIHEPRNWASNQKSSSTATNDSISAHDSRSPPIITIGIDPESWDQPQRDESYQMPGAFLPSSPRRTVPLNLGKDQTFGQSSSNHYTTWGLPRWLNPFQNDATGSQNVSIIEAHHSTTGSGMSTSASFTAPDSSHIQRPNHPSDDTGNMTSDDRVSSGTSAKSYEARGRSSTRALSQLNTNVFRPSFTNPIKSRSNWKDFSPRSSLNDKPIAEKPRPYEISEIVAEQFSNSHQVQLGQPAVYGHAEGSVSYQDSFDRPYAAFVFKYRSRGMFSLFSNKVAS